MKSLTIALMTLGLVTSAGAQAPPENLTGSPTTLGQALPYVVVGSVIGGGLLHMYRVGEIEKRRFTCQDNQNILVNGLFPFVGAAAVNNAWRGRRPIPYSIEACSR